MCCVLATTEYLPESPNVGQENSSCLGMSQMWILERYNFYKDGKGSAHHVLSRLEWESACKGSPQLVTQVDWAAGICTETSYTLNKKINGQCLPTSCCEAPSHVVWGVQLHLSPFHTLLDAPRCPRQHTHLSDLKEAGSWGTRRRWPTKRKGWSS